MKSVFEMDASEYRELSKDRAKNILWADLDDFADYRFINEDNKYEMYNKHFIALCRLRSIYEGNRTQ